MREKEKILENKLLIIETELAYTERVTEEEKVREYTKLKNEQKDQGSKDQSSNNKISKILRRQKNK